MRAGALALPFLLPVVAACAPGRPTVVPAGLRSPFTGYASALYSDPKKWLCLPEKKDDACHADLDATELRPDGSRVVVHDHPAAAPKVDCFYVYPTVDLGLFPGNHDDLEDTEKMATATRAQAARLRDVCDVYVPLYRQITIGTYFVVDRETRDRYLDVAFSDVEDAFLHYMGQRNRGRKIVLAGHSQGAWMVVKLLQKFFDHDPAMREKLLMALAIGTDLDTPREEPSGATLSNVPLCTKDGETGCVVAYRSYRLGANPTADWLWPDKAGDTTACVNPADPGGNGLRPLTTYLPVFGGIGKYLDVAGVTTPFVLLRGFYAGTCVEGDNGVRMFAVTEARAPGDRRASPFDLRDWKLDTQLGLHVLDWQLPQGELVDMVARAAATVP